MLRFKKGFSVSGVFLTSDYMKMFWKSFSGAKRFYNHKLLETSQKRGEIGIQIKYMKYISWN